jgi:hypothetical protein
MATAESRSEWPGLPLGVANQDISGPSQTIREPRRFKAAL